MNIVRTFENGMKLSNALQQRLDYCGKFNIKYVARQFLMNDPIPDFYQMELETLNRCNNICPFCPVNKNDDPRKLHRMDENLFDLIIDQLHYMDYHGYISLYSNNEPLLDNRIFHFLEKAKQKLPNAKHAMYTNGLLLDIEKFLHLVNHLDLLVIDNYNDDFELIPPIKKIVDAKLEENWKCNVTISLRKQHQKLTTRGGNAPNRINEENLYHRHSPCILPFVQIVVRPDGTIAKCCNDPVGSMTLGDLKHQTLREIWRGKKYQEFRREMYNNGTIRIKGCDVCDAAYGFYTYVPQYMMKEAHDHFIDEIHLQKNLNEIYVFDTNKLSQNIFNMLSNNNVIPDGYITVSENVPEGGGGSITLQEALGKHVFIIIPSPYYEDNLFYFLQQNGYQWGKDYIVFM